MNEPLFDYAFIASFSQLELASCVIEPIQFSKPRYMATLAAAFG